MQDNKIPFAKSVNNNRMVDVNSVPRGLACNCICPKCKAHVEACRGEQMRYFRHEKAYDGIARDCTGSYETALHLTAKQVFETSTEIWLPEKVFDPGKNLPCEIVEKEHYFSITKVDIEKTEGDIVPDIVLYSGSEKLYCEIFVTHAVDDVKKEKLYKNGCQTLEIDLSEYNERRIQPDLSELKELLLGKNEKKKWAFDSVQLVDKRNKYKKVKVLQAQWIESEGKYRVTGCPKNNRENSEYSNEDCKSCPFCAEITCKEDRKEITCTAYAGFSVHDPIIDREWTYNYIVSAHKERAKENDSWGKAETFDWSDRPSMPETNSTEISQHIRPEDLKRFETGSAKDLPWVIDDQGKRIIKCIVCSKLGRISDFSTYGGTDLGVNYGVHSRTVNKGCEETYYKCRETTEMLKRKKPEMERPLCPLCGEKMIMRNGYSKFWGCSNFPNCRGSRPFNQLYKDI